ncbi:unnamed protein product [Adineta steineri]|uniref:Uncharacterized protein n=2 Tax=Adineta steineri TaxID=433720 RepID=A0A815CAR4_9BILA|nr:unnamed protein product [Adineta steineri]CAF1284717.1 unnamed protein product [Adineta steineri]CAF3590703.1 unnamed protein product [Adineta steineri]CAF4077130.1 unnamed protein product [Adineta steineri]
MPRTMNLIILTIFIVLCYTQLISCDTYCACKCCLGQPCTPTSQGSLFLDACTDLRCTIQCRMEYPRSCPPEGVSGITEGRCTSDPPPGSAIQQKANIALITIFFSIFCIVKLYM